MSMEHWSLGRLARGNPADIPLPPPEAPVETKRFSSEQREALGKEGYLIYVLTGQSINTLRDDGRRFLSTWHKLFPDFEALGSRQSEVAMDPDRLFLPGSNNKTLKQQEVMVEEFSQELGKKVPGVKAIIGQAPDYVELALRHLDATKDYLFGVKYNHNYTRTKTLMGSSDVACVGNFRGGFGLSVFYWNADFCHGYLRAAPLVVPV